MTKLIINNRVFKTHPIYTLYAASRDGYIIHIIKQKPNKGNKDRHGYMKCKVRQHGQSGFKNYRCSRFIYECFNDVIPKGKVIDHQNDDKEDNRLCNLKLMTQQQNCKKAVKNRATFNNYQNIRSVKAINKEMGEVSYYFSLYSANQHLNINSKQIQDVCCGIQKFAQSKNDGQWYKFKYVDKDLDVNYIKSKNIRPRKKTDQEKKETKLKWWNQEYKCDKCGFITKNSSKYRHIKKCPK